MNRARYLIAYDITDAKRLSRVHKKVEAYAIGGQKSFYECWLTTTEFLQLTQTLLNLILPPEDRLTIFQLHQKSQPLLYGKAHLQSIEPLLLI